MNFLNDVSIFQCYIYDNNINNLKTKIEQMLVKKKRQNKCYNTYVFMPKVIFI